MPLTPFHLGPSLLFGLLLFSLIDLPAFLVAGVILDIEPLLNLMSGSFILHGFFHSFLGATVVGLTLGLVMYALRKPIRQIMAFFRLGQESSVLKVCASALLGVYLHVLLDAPLYPDMQPFYPLEINPFYGAISPLAIYLFCSICFVIAVFAYISRIRKNQPYCSQ
ncbi:MAG: hypothetical protein V1676_03265 [Candidatus Diapherotrites archaeon]